MAVIAVVAEVAASSLRYLAEPLDTSLRDCETKEQLVSTQIKYKLVVPVAVER